MKKIISIFLSIFILMMSFTFCSIAEDEISGICGESLTWSYDKASNTLIIEGNGNMYDWYSNRKVPWKHLRADATALSLPEGLTYIGNYAFFGFENVSKLNIPSTVRSIGHGAFSVWKSLKEVNIPNGVTSLGGWVFASCTSLEKVNFPSTLTSIEYECFLNCPKLLDVTVPKTLTSLGRLSLGILESHSINFDMIIRGVPGSNAQSYASTYFLNFVSVNAKREASFEMYSALAGYKTEKYTIEEMDYNGDGIITPRDSFTFKITEAN